MMDADISTTTQDNISLLLQRHCIDTQLYLQHDLTIHQLATAVGTNRYYLSQYFSRQGTTYNAYINELRIDHFISLYHHAVAAKEHFTVRSLAKNSGYRNYTTFSRSFNQRMGKNVTAWMQESSET
jgi:AraC-like DNA-binding protein